MRADETTLCLPDQRDVQDRGLPHPLGQPLQPGEEERRLQQAQHSKCVK